MPAPTLKVGSITIVSLTDGSMSPKAADLLPHVTPAQWEELAEYLNPDGTMTFNFGSFLIYEGDSLTLVDTGFGGREGTAGGLLMDDFEKANVKPEDVTRVIITHLHGDHIGWNTIDRDGKPDVLFKNARFVIQRKDWDHWIKPEMFPDRPLLELCAVPLEEAGVLDLVDGDQPVSAGISTLFTPGHTPGHQSVLVSSGDEKAIILGDVTHMPFQLFHTDWSPPFDTDPDESARTRAEVFDRIEQQGLKVAAGHYPYPSFGGIVRVEGKRRWQPMS